MIEIKNLSVGFKDKTILKNLKGIINEGDLIALMGINGVGKSTLLRTLTGLTMPLAGEIHLDKKNYSTLSPLELAQSIAVVLTEKVQMDYLQVSELVELGRSPHSNSWGKLSDADSKIIREITDLLNISSIQNKFFSDLSDGQKQKVLLARALAQSPRYLFLDEPTTYLDIPSKIELMSLFKDLSKNKNIAVFFSTHDWNLVENVVDKIWLIDAEGKLHSEGPESLKSSGLLKKNFNI